MNAGDFFTGQSVLEEIHLPLLKLHQIRLYVKRDDLLHPYVSGNKWRKLKYNLLALKQNGYKGILTYGGAYSNHLHATAAAGNLFDFPTAGIVRGEEPEIWSETLKQCHKAGMQLHFISRSGYRAKEESYEVRKIMEHYSGYMHLPEGGENELARLGCAEILGELEFDPDFICLACGTGTTMAGLLLSPQLKSTVLGFPVLKGADVSISENISKTMPPLLPGKIPHQLISDYHFGGYARYTSELLKFIKEFRLETGLALEQVYTGKMMYGIIDLISKGFFTSGCSIVAVHTGGMQGLLPELGE